MLFTQATTAVNAVSTSSPLNKQQHRQADQRGAVQHHVGDHALHHARAHGAAAHHHRVDHIGMHDAHQLAPRLLQQQQHADHLDAAAGRSGAGGEAAQQDHQQRCEHRPLRVVVRSDSRVVVATDTTWKTVRRSVCKGSAWRSLAIKTSTMSPTATSSTTAKARALDVAPQHAERALPPRDEVQREVHAGQQHEHDGHDLDARRVPVAEAERRATRSRRG